MFQGFTQGAVDFLWGIRFNNERSWFLAHKEEYLTLVDRPMRELGSTGTPGGSMVGGPTRTTCGSPSGGPGRSG